jgi:DNA-binding NarL/FixJ family response regulator
MSVAGTRRERNVVAAAAHGTVALIAGGEDHVDASDTIAAILAREGFALASFDCVEEVTAIDAPDELSVILLWLENTISSVPGLVDALTKHFDELPVVLACIGIQRWEVRSALASGAAGIVTYDVLETTLGPCLHAVRAGQVCVPRGHWRQIEPPMLSTREKQILGLVVMGYMNSQIAEHLFLAESTVKSHLSSAFGKLGVRSRNEAVDLIVNPERGFGMGILGLVGEPIEAVVGSAS